MTDSQLDEIFKKQLPGHESPVPEDMWERIIQKKGRDRKGFFFPFSLMSLFILGFVTAGILLFHVNRKEVVRIKQTVSDSNTVSGTGSVQPAANDHMLEKDSSFHRLAEERAAGNLVKPSMQKEYLKFKLSSKDRQTEIQHAQSGTKNNSGGTTQIEANTDAASNLSANSNSENKGKTSGDSARLTDQKANPAMLSTPKLLAGDSTKNTTAKKQDSTKKEAGRKWSLDLYGSPDYPIVYGDPSVETKLSYTAGLRVNRLFGKRFSGTIGIQFSQLNYNFKSDSSGYLSPGYLKSLDLPVLAGYSWGNKTFGMTINAGVIFNLYSWHDSTNFSANYFKSNTGLSLYLGFHLEKQIKERLSIFTEPYYRYRLSSMTASSVNFLKFIDVAGVSFGARYYFGK